MYKYEVNATLVIEANDAEEAESEARDILDSQLIQFHLNSVDKLGEDA